MHCSNCDRQNPVDAKLCLNCGQGLEITCPSCAITLPLDARFCMSCGHEVEAGSTKGMAGHTTHSAAATLSQTISDAAAKGERRIITMLFVDVIGSTAAAEKLDPEVWANVMGGAFDRFIQPVERYEGSVARMLGDAILAYFGAPIAHEDDPQRAILAALAIMEATREYSAEIHQRHGVELNCRIGINTGLVVVGEVGSEMYSEYAALGDAANIAARMEQTAQAGAIQVAEATHRLTAPLFDFESVGDIELKGRADPLAAYRVVGVSATPGRLRGIEGLKSPLVGRDVEFEMLTTAIQNLKGGRGQIVSLIAEAGLGKSRMASELRAHADSVAVDWVEGASFSYDTKTPFAPAISIVAACLGLDDVEESERYEKLCSEIARGEGPDVRADSVLLATLLGIEPHAEDQKLIAHLLGPQVRQMTIEAIVRHLEHTAGEGPLVVMFEDLHWADPASIELIGRLMGATDRTSLMVLALFRSDPDEPAWEFHELAQQDFPHRYTSVFLQALSDDHSRDLVANLLLVDGLDPAVRDSILAKAEGNPFFVEEVIRSLLDDGTIVAEGDRFVATTRLTSIAVPDTLSSVIATRLDRLRPNAKRLLQTASVIGREFDRELIGLLTDPSVDVDEILTGLQRRELIVQAASAPEPTYSFKHALTMDTAYHILLVSARTELHREVGKLIEQRHPDRAVELARHFINGDEPAKAIGYLVQAATNMAYAFAIPDAIEYFEKALELSDEQTAISVVREAYEGLANAQLFSADLNATVRTLTRMRAFGEARDDTPTRVSAMNKEGFAQFFLAGDVEAAESLVTEALELAEKVGDLSGQAECHVNFCAVNTVQGNLDAAADHLSDMTQVGAAIDSDYHRVFAMTHRANTLMLLTRFDEAEHAITEALAAAEETGQKTFVGEIVGSVKPWMVAAKGDVRAALELSNTGVAISEEISDVVHLCYGLTTAGYLAKLLGRYEEALQLLQEAQYNADLIGANGLGAFASACKAVIMFDIHGPDSEQGHCVVELTEEALSKPTGLQYGPIVFGDLAYQALRQNNLEAAENYLDRGFDAASPAWILGRPNLMLGVAQIAVIHGDRVALSDQAVETAEFLDGHHIGWSFPRLRFVRGAAALMDDDAAEATRLFDEATELARSMHLLPESLSLNQAAEMLLSKSGHEEASARHGERAKRDIGEMAALFGDRGLRAAYEATNTMEAVG